MFEVEKGVPMPKPVRAGRQTKYPWKELAVGDSFFVPADAVKPQSARGAVRTANRIYADRRFATRTVEGGIRVWRIE